MAELTKPKKKSKTGKTKRPQHLSLDENAAADLLAQCPSIPCLLPDDVLSAPSVDDKEITDECVTCEGETVDEPRSSEVVEADRIEAEDAVAPTRDLDVKDAFCNAETADDATICDVGGDDATTAQDEIRLPAAQDGDVVLNDGACAMGSSSIEAASTDGALLPDVTPAPLVNEEECDAVEDERVGNESETEIDMANISVRFSTAGLSNAETASSHLYPKIDALSGSEIYHSLKNVGDLPSAIKELLSEHVTNEVQGEHVTHEVQSEHVTNEVRSEHVTRDAEVEMHESLSDSYCKDHFSGGRTRSTWSQQSGVAQDLAGAGLVAGEESLLRYQMPIEPTASASVAASRSATRVEHRRLGTRFRDEEAVVMETAIMQPFTCDQLLSLYHNPMLDYQQLYLDYFIRESNQERHPFYEIVLNYHRARNQLSRALKDVASLQTDIARNEKLIWTFPDRTINIQGQCADAVNLTETHTFREAMFNQSACNSIDQSLTKLRTLVYEDASQYIYTGVFARLQVESYIYGLYMNCPYLRDIPYNAPVQAFFPGERPYDAQDQVTTLKECISVLFMFLRKPNADDEFKKDLEVWLTRLAASLLRVATYEDHVYLLQHILRCPSGAAKWTAALLQVPPAGVGVMQSDFGSALLDHAVVVLNALMTPVKSRPDFLLPLKVGLTSLNETDLAWTLVDSDGEEDEDPVNSWHFLSENDVDLLLDQIPLDVLFRHVLAVDNQMGQDIYNICRYTENGMLKLCAFCTCLIEIFGRGLQTYNLCRYRQLNKRIGRSIRHIIQYATDHWLNFQYFYNNLANESRARLQLEYDQLFMRATKQILSSQKLGSWQFMADLPYTTVSISTMWRLLWVMHHDATDPRSDRLTLKQCMLMLEDPDERCRFEESLVNVAMSEAIYLLTTFANMARARPACDVHFVAAVSMEVYELAYLTIHTREIYSKVGRELLTSIALEHPFIISVVLQKVKESMSKIGVVSLYLFRQLPLYLWQPGEEDLDVIRHWLLDFDLAAPESHLARQILTGLNWSSNLEGACPALDLSVHQRIAVLLVEVCMKHIPEKNLVFMLTDSVKQVTSALRNTPTNEYLLSNWAWDLAFDLRLHCSCQPGSSIVPCPEWSLFPAPDLESSDLCVPVQKALKANRTFGHYICLVMTNMGHDSSEFTHNGLPLLLSLVQNGDTVACVHVLDNIVPQFYDRQEYLVNNERFQSVVHRMVMTDQSYSKMAKNLLYTDFPCYVIRLVTGMIQHHLQRASQCNEEAVRKVVLFWLQLLTKLHKWNLDRNICYILDQIVSFILTSPAARQASEAYFLVLYQCYLDSQTNVVTSMFSWIASGNTLPSLAENSMPEFPNLAFMILQAQTRYEDECGLWTGLVTELMQDGGIPVESAVKKVSHRLKLPLAPIAGKLCIYRWLQQAMDTDPCLPVSPLLYQQFFMRYLARPVTNSVHVGRSGVGERFFQSRANTTLVKSVKQKLIVTADYLDKRAKEQDKTENNDENQEEFSPQNKEYKPSPAYCRTLASVYRTYSYWLDEPRLHDASLHLPALPSQYQPERLAMVLDNRKLLWLDFVDFDRIGRVIDAQIADWTTKITSQPFPLRTNYKSLQEEVNPTAATDRIIHRLNKRDSYLPPPNLIVLRAPVPDVDTRCLHDSKALMFSLHTDLAIITQYASSFAGQTARFSRVNTDYVDILPKLHTNEPKQMTFNLVCTSYNPRHRCLGAAVATAQYSAHEIVEPMVRRSVENRIEYEQLLIAALMPPPENVCAAAVHVENTISALIGCYQNPPANLSASNVSAAGVGLFYHLISLVNNETMLYIPTRQFFASCIEILGQKFVTIDGSQCSVILETIVEHPDLSGLLSPNFIPNKCPEQFVEMYVRLVKVIPTHGPVLVFMLLSKFDISQWLSLKPPASELSNLQEALSKGLMLCGPSPEDQVCLVFGIYRTHYKTIISAQFPDNFYSSLHLIVEGSASEKWSVLVWEDLLTCLGLAAGGNEAKNSTTAHLKLQLQAKLSISMVTDISVYLCNYFARLRQSTSVYRSYGLYPVWGKVVPYFCRVCAFLCEAYIEKLMTSVTSAGLDPNQGMQLSWKTITDMFSAWLVPLPYTRGQVVLIPWLQADEERARVVVQEFVRQLHAVYRSFNGLILNAENSPLTLIWRYYVTTLAVNGSPGHVIELLQSELISLPWSQFYPSGDTLRMMIDLYNHEHKSVFVFVSRVFVLMPWSTILQHYVQQSRDQSSSELVSMLLQLLVQFAARSEIVNEPSMLAILAHCEQIPSNMVDAQCYGHVTAWFLENCEAACVLADRGANITAVIRLLKTLAEMEENHPQHPDYRSKQCLYVRLIISFLGRCANHTKMVTERLSLIITNLLTEVEGVVSRVSDPKSRDQHGTVLLTEMLALLNSCNPRSDVMNVAVTSYRDWMTSSPDSVLLVPSIGAACKAVGSTEHVVQIICTSIRAYFISPAGVAVEERWRRIVSALEVTEVHNKDFRRKCLDEGCYLVLYARLLQQQQQQTVNVKVEDEYSSICAVVDWFGQVKPSNENECELLLWLDRLLDMVCHQIDSGVKPAAMAVLVARLCTALSLLSEDKTSSGLLGAIGLGKRSSLSVRFRLVVRSSACFLICQIIEGQQLRLSAATPGAVRDSKRPSSRRPGYLYPTQQALEALSALESLRSNKLYQPIRDHVNFACEFVSNPLHSLRDYRVLLSRLSLALFPDVLYLRMIRV